MGLGGVAFAAVPSVVRLQLVFSDRVGGVILTILISYIIIEVCIYVGNKIKKIPKVGKYII